MIPRSLKPSPLTLAALLAFLWSVSFGAVRDFVWADLKSGMMNLGGLSRRTRAVVWFGFGLVLLMVGMLLVNDFLRQLFSLIALPNAPSFAPGRGMMLPAPLVPVTMFFLAAAWAFALAGAIHAHRAVTIGLLVYFFLRVVRLLVQQMASFSVTLSPLRALLVLAVNALVLFSVLVFLGVRRRRAPRPALEFGVLFGVLSLLFALTSFVQWSGMRQTGIPLSLVYFQMDMLDLGIIAGPFLLSLGVDIAGFAHDSSKWVTRLLLERLPKIAPAAALFLLGGWRLFGLVGDLVQEARSSTSPASLLKGYAGAAGELVCVGLVWLGVELLARRAHQERREMAEEIVAAAGKIALPLILVFNAASLLGIFMTSLLTLVPLPFIVNPGLRLSTAVSGASTGWGIAVNLAAIGLALFLARRGQRALPLYLGIFGAEHLYYALTNPDAWLGAFTWRGPQYVDLWWTLAFTLLGIALLATGRLTAPRAAKVFFLLFIVFLLRQTGFISNPLTPFFGFAGVGFIAFGILWDALTSGSWANQSTPRLPRTSRIFLYLSYVLLTVTVVNVAVSSHDLSSVSQLTGDIALVGLDRFGRPMLYGLFVLTLRDLFSSAEGAAAEDRPGN